MTSTSAELIATLSIPSTYVNHVRLSSVNGVFRLTFSEQVLADATSPPVAAPRCAVTLTRDCAAELASLLTAFISQVDAANALGAEARASGSLQ